MGGAASPGDNFGGAAAPARSAAPPGTGLVDPPGGFSQYGAPANTNANPGGTLGTGQPGTGFGGTGLGGTGQGSTGTPSSIITRPAAPAGQASAAPASGRIAPPEMVAELLRLPERTAVAGRPLSLLDALANARDRTRQLDVTHAYWRLVQSLGSLRAAYDLAAAVQFQTRPDDTGMLRTAQASASAAVQAAELAVARAQYELAEAGQLNPSVPLPLPADAPHVGPYRTGFDEMFAARGVAPRARLINRVIPVRSRAIDARAAAVLAADDTVRASLEAYQSGRIELSAVLAALNQWAEQRSGLIAAVCDYNHDIVEYALAVVGPQVSNPVLVSMLIRTSAGVTQPAVTPGGPGAPVRPIGGGAMLGTPYEVQPAGAYGLPGGVPAASPIPATFGVPGGAFSPQPQGLMKEEPTLAPPRDRLRAPPGDRPAPALQRPEAKSPGLPGQGEPAPLLPQGGASEARPLPMQPIERTSFRLLAADTSTLALYAGLADADPSVRTKQLGAYLSASRNLPKEQNQTVELGELLRSPFAVDRRAMIEAFWTTSQRAAQYQTLAQQLELLNPIEPIALGRRNQPSGSRDMLCVRAARLAADADRLDAQVALLQAQFDLTERAGRPPDSAWLLPATAPHAGPYFLNLDARPRELTATWQVKRSAAAVPALHETLQRRAAAVVAADAARSAAVSSYQSGTVTVDRLLFCVRAQARETLAFLETLGGYNRSIAQYVLAVVPSSLSGDQLLGTLVLAK